MKKPIKPLSLFQGYGVEMEYMLVNQKNLKVLPYCDKVLKAIAGKICSEVKCEDIAWSNELVAHVIELKTNGPVNNLNDLAQKFQKNIIYINSILKQYDAKLLPTGAHPFMDPIEDTILWQHDHNKIYEKYNAIFNCQGHGWSNLQSTHLNLAFANNHEFVKLHSAIRLILPILPALSASTPILNGQITGFLDTRLEFYRKNQQKIPSITGHVIPEAILSIEDYKNRILEPMYEAIAPYDKDKILQEEWLNSRGAIARFDRNAIEIRIIDTQECPAADIAIIELIVALLKNLVAESWLTLEDQLQLKEEALSSIFLEVIKKGGDAVITMPSYLKAFGYNEQNCSVNTLWQIILENENITNLMSNDSKTIMNTIVLKGNLATRIIKDLKNDFSHQKIKDVYKNLSECLNEGKLFISN